MESKVTNESEDAELVSACQSGDRKAFKILLSRYQRRIYAVAYGFLKNREDALDVVQESFIKVHRYIEKFEGNSSFYTWLYRITANLCIDQLRRAKRKRELGYDDSIRREQVLDGALASSGLTKLGDPSNLMHRKEIMAAVEEAMEHLSEKHRAVIVMREFQGMSYEEMAQSMECSKGTIMSRLFHARKNLQKMLNVRLCLEESEGASASDEAETQTDPKMSDAQSPAAKELRLS